MATSRATRPRFTCGAAVEVGLCWALVVLAGCPASSISTDPCDQPGTICTVAGTGKSQFDGDGRDALDTSLYLPLDVEFDPQGRPLILDFNNLRVRRMNDDGAIETIMGLDFEAPPMDGALAVETPLHHASDIEFDASGNLYVAGDHAPIVFRVGLDNRVTIVAGNGDSGYDGDGGPALAARLRTPFGVLPDASGGFFISDVDAHVVRYVDAGGMIRTVAGNGAAGYSGDGGPAAQAQLRGPTRMAQGLDGSLYVCDTDNHCIRRIDGNGAIETVCGDGTPGYSGDGGPASAAQLDGPYGLALGPDGSLYVADTENNVIRRVDAGGVITTIVGTGAAGFAGDGETAGACALDRPSGVTIAADGALWISDSSNHRVRRVAGVAAR